MKIRDTALANDGRLEAGAWLKSLREAKGLSQADLAAEIEAPHYTYISQMETGRRSIPTYHIDDLARVFGWSQSAFAKLLLSHQDPFVHAALFESEDAFRSVKIRALAPKPAADHGLEHRTLRHFGGPASGQRAGASAHCRGECRARAASSIRQPGPKAPRTRRPRTQNRPALELDLKF